MVDGNANFNTLATTTLVKYASDNLADNVFASSALYYLLAGTEKLRGEGSKTYKELDGGLKIVEPLLYASNSTAGSYSGYDVLDTDPQDGMTNAEFEWKQYSVSVSISGKEKKMNNGDSAVLNLLEGKIMQAEMSLIEAMNGDLFTDGTGNDSKDITGLVLAIDSAGTYGNIVRSANSWWGAQETAVTGPLTIDVMRTMYNDCSKGYKKAHPDLLITDQTEYEAYEAKLQPDMRFSDNELADAGFMNLAFKGAKLVFDESCNDGVMYYENTDVTGIRVHKDAKFSVTEEKQPVDQDAFVKQILWMGNLVTKNCSRLGKLTGLDG
jgi:hypothetical protein